MTTKRQQAADFFTAGKFKKALRIYRTFKDRFTAQELRSIEIAHESLSGHAGFYAGLGVDTNAAMEQAKAVISNKFFNK